jgi:hypothetical protein
VIFFSIQLKFTKEPLFLGKKKMDKPPENSENNFCGANEDAELEILIRELQKVVQAEDEFLLRKLYEDFVLGRLSENFCNKLKKLQEKYRL